MNYLPGIDMKKIKESTDEDIHKKITELNKRMGIAMRFGRAEVINQLGDLLDFYKTILFERSMVEIKKEMDADPTNFQSIDIDWPDPADSHSDDNF